MVRDSAIELSRFPELARLAEEVRATRRRRILRRDGENVAVLAPLPLVRRRVKARKRDRTAEALATVERTAGIFRAGTGASPATVEEETAAFEQGIADEVARGSGV